MTHRSVKAVLVACLLTALGLGLVAWAAASADGPAAPPIELLFLYGSEKKDWLNEVTPTYHGMINGRPVHVELAPMGSGDIVDAVLHEKLQPTLISPASKAYLILGDEWAKKEKCKDPLIAGNPRSLFRSPVVIAMWKPMAEALGWPKKPVSWKALHDLAANKDGWKSVGHEEWGAFKFGHTHPEKSNSGLLALLEEVYASAGKKEGLTVKDVEAGAPFLTDLERSIVHYHTSTGFISNTMLGNGPDYFSAAVMYESLVVDSYLHPVKLNEGVQQPPPSWRSTRKRARSGATTPWPWCSATG